MIKDGSSILPDSTEHTPHASPLEAQHCGVFFRICRNIIKGESMEGWPLVVFFGLVALKIWFHECNEIDKGINFSDRWKKRWLSFGKECGKNDTQNKYQRKWGKS